MSEVSFDTENAIDEKLRKLTGKASMWQLQGGVEKTEALAILVLSAIGWLASLQLILAEKAKLTNPAQALTCDINPWIGCGKWIGSWQNEVFFGISNSVLGLGGFSALIMLGLVFLTRGSFGAALWKILSLGATGGLAWVAWFMYQSYVVEGSLCPYCVVVWLVTLSLTYLLLRNATQAGYWGAKAQKVGEFLARNQLVILLITYLLWGIATGFWYWDNLG